jgi:uncharacterized membrane protein YphA (DoxX/SURF4 family)
LIAASGAAIAARIVVGVTLVVSGSAKIAGGRAWTRGAAASGVPRAVASGLPVAELVLGAAVVTGLWSPWPAVVAIGMLAAFSAWILVQLARGRHPNCACFGSLSASALSWRHAARNAALIALAALAAAG